MTAKLHAPHGIDSLSANGEFYPVKSGVIEIPEELIDTAIDHGFFFDEYDGHEESKQENIKNEPLEVEKKKSKKVK